MSTTAAVRKLASSVEAFQVGGAREILNRFRINAKELRAWFLGVKIDGCHFSVRSVPVLLRRELITRPYEQPERISSRQYIDPRLPIIELGGCIGVVSCVANRLIDKSLKHVVVEANPKLVPFIRANAKRNRCDLEVVNAAVYHEAGFVSFNIGNGEVSPLASSLLGNAPLRLSVNVPTCSLADLVDRFHIQECNLICDIEGSEYDLIQNELDVIRRYVKRIVMEVHPNLLGLAKTEWLIHRLERAGFVPVSKIDSVVSFVRDDDKRTGAALA